MGKICSFCKNKIGFWSMQIPFKDGVMGGKCMIKYGLGTKWNFSEGAKEYGQQHTVQEFKDFVNSGHQWSEIQEQYIPDEVKKELAKKAEKKAEIEKYEATLQEFKNNHAHKYSHYYIDLKTNRILRTKFLLDTPRVIDFKEVLSYQINRNGHTEKKHHGITRAVVGGALAGGVGAIVGATTGGKNNDYVDHLGVIINLRDGSNDEIVIHSLGKEKANSFSAKMDESDLKSLISDIEAGMAAVADESNNLSDSTVHDTADEIAKFKKLADEGTITQAEFEAKKKQLLNL